MITDAREWLARIANEHGRSDFTPGDLDAILRTSWRERTIAAKARGCFTDTDIRLVTWWGTCGVGEQALRMPEVVLIDFALGPLDDRMRSLGSVGRGFTHAVLTNDFALASTLLDEIDDRALQLKRGAA